MNFGVVAEMTPWTSSTGAGSGDALAGPLAYPGPDSIERCIGAGSPVVVFLQQPLPRGGGEGFFSLRESWRREVGGPWHQGVKLGLRNRGTSHGK